MRTKIFLLGIVSITASGISAQQFIKKAVIEYEVRANIKKTMGNNVWQEMMKDNMPTYKTGYYNFAFADNKSVYKFDHWAPGPKFPDFMRKSDEENLWYFDHSSGKFDMQKNVYGTNFNVEDSIPALKWKLTNENRVIAGFNCRKAVAIMFDSVYVFAFYTDEIMISGGPATINGLPGMILGVTIPRLYTSWIATKVMINNVDENQIKPVAAKKPSTFKSLKAVINDRMKDWYNGDNDEAEARQQKDRFIWNLLL